jgi:hypothetical protein
LAFKASKFHKIDKKNIIFEDPLERFDWKVHEGLRLEPSNCFYVEVKMYKNKSSSCESA